MSDTKAAYRESLERYGFSAVVALLVLAAIWTAYSYLQRRAQVTTITGQNVVVFDVVKMANAQRAMAARLLGKDAVDAGDAAVLAQVREGTRDTIRAVAGPGTVVLVKQAVVHTDIPDITDEVLRRLKLPTDVPSQDPAAAVLDPTPTILGLQPAPAPRKPANSGARADHSEGLLP